jgi:hypothetical protein
MGVLLLDIRILTHVIRILFKVSVGSQEIGARFVHKFSDGGGSAKADVWGVGDFFNGMHKASVAHAWSIRLVNNGSSSAGRSVGLSEGVRSRELIHSPWSAHEGCVVEDATWSKLVLSKILDLDAGALLIVQPNFAVVFLLKDALAIFIFLATVLAINIRLLNFWLIISRYHRLFDLFWKYREFSLRNKRLDVLIAVSSRPVKLAELGVLDACESLWSGIQDYKCVFKIELLEPEVLKRLYGWQRFFMFVLQLFKLNSFFSLFINFFEGFYISGVFVLVHNFLLHFFKLRRSV